MISSIVCNQKRQKADPVLLLSNIKVIQIMPIQQTITPTGIHDINTTTLKLYRERVKSQQPLPPTRPSSRKRSLGEEAEQKSQEEIELGNDFFKDATYITLSHIRINFQAHLDGITTTDLAELQSLISRNPKLYEDEVVLSLVEGGGKLLVRNRKRNTMTVKPLFTLTIGDLQACERLKRDLRFTNSVTVKNNRHLKYAPPTLSMSVQEGKLLRIEISYEIQVIESLILTHTLETGNNVRELVSFLVQEKTTGQQQQQQKKKKVPPVTNNRNMITADLFYKAITEKAQLMTDENVESNLFVEDLDTDLLAFQKDSVKWMLRKEGVYYDEKTRILKPLPLWSKENIHDDNVTDQDQEILDKLNRLSFGFRITKFDNETHYFFNRFSSNICSRETAIKLLQRHIHTDEYLSKAAKGILAEEMGLGKTIELVSLSLLNPRPEIQIGGLLEANDRKVEKVKSTLVIVPDTILHQWIDEIQLHAPKTSVFWYKGLKVHSSQQQRMVGLEIRDKFKESDFIITSYAVITAEVHSALYNPDRAKRTRRKTNKANVTEEYKEWLTQEQQFSVDAADCDDDDDAGMVTWERTDRTSPLVMVEFWRLIWDESQMVGGFKSNLCTMSTLIPRFHSWSVSGTPMKNNNAIEDLISTLVFLRVEPFKSQQRQFAKLSRDEFLQLFASLGIRHTKQMVKDQIRIPPQQRILLAAPFGKIQQDLYLDSFKNFLSDVGLDENGNPVVDNWEPSSSYYELMNRWLNKLRRLCCHPFLVMEEAGKEYRKSKRLENKRRKNGHNNENIDSSLRFNGNAGDQFSVLRASAQSMSVVLKKIVDDLNEKVQQFEKERILSYIELGQICEFEKKPLDALKIWEEQIPSVIARIDSIKLKSQILHHEKQISENSKDVEQNEQELVDDQIEINHQALKSSLELLHRLYFFIANAHYQSYNKNETITEKQAGNAGNPEMRVLNEEEQTHQNSEVEFYSNAQSIRREILKESIDEIDSAILKLETQISTIVEATKIISLRTFPLKEFENLENQTYVLRTQTLINHLNTQNAIINQWYGELVKLLKLPLFDSNSEPSGEEYTTALDSQGKIATYLDFLQRIIRDRDVVLNGQMAANNITEISGSNNDDHNDHDDDIASGVIVDIFGNERIKKKMKEEYDMASFREPYSLRGLLIDARALINRNSANLTSSEGLKLSDVVFKSKELFEKQRGTDETLKKQFRLLNSIYNSQIKYYRQLQAISDNCTSFTKETHMYYDVYDNRRRLANKIRLNDEQSSKINQRLRFLRSIEEAEICTICQCSITLGSFTKCGHRFCKDCLAQWLRNRAMCPVCKERVVSSELYEFTLNREEINVRQNVEHGHHQNQYDDANKQQLEQLYSKYSEKELSELNDIRIRNDYGTKINLIVRQVLYLKAKDDDVQILVYSQWSDFLELISKALEENGINHLSSKHTLPRLSGSGKSNIKASVQQFKADPSVTCFLLNARSNASGLNLVNATHVFLCEPLVQTALELQAISRIHRIGQKSPTTIWCFTIKDTVEESIILLSTRKKIKEEESLDTRELTKSSRNLLGKSGEVVEESELWNSFFSSKTEELL